MSVTTEESKAVCPLVLDVTRSLQQRQPRIGQHRREVGQELRALLSVDQAVVEGDRQLGHPTRLDALWPITPGSRTDHPRPAVDRAEGDDARLARVQDRGAGVD